MELSDYVRAVASRWVWLLGSGVLGLVLSGTLGVLTPPTYEATASLYVGAARVDGPEGPAYAARIRDDVLPSVAGLARSGSVLTRVADQLDLSVSATRLADAVTVDVEDDISVLAIAVSDESPSRAARMADAIAREVSRQSAQLMAGASGPLLETVLVRPAALPRFPETPAPSRSAPLGAAAGLGLAVVGAGLVELARPRVRGRRDVAGVTAAPVLAVLPEQSDAAGDVDRAGRAFGYDTHPDRSEELLRLSGVLGSVASGDRPPRIAVLDATRGSSGIDLVHELAALPQGARGGPAATPAPDLVVVPGSRAIDAAGPFDGVLVLTDGRRTTVRQLRASLGAVGAAGAPLIGVVVDGLLPPRATWRSRLRAGIRGDASWWMESRTPVESGPPSPDSSSTTARVTAALAVAALGFTRPLPLAVTTGLLASVALLPVWAPAVRRYRGATALVALAGLGLVSGVLLAWFSSRDHDFARYEAAQTTVLVITLVGGTGLLLWARTVLPLPVLGVAFGAGTLAAAILAVPGSENAFKFQLGFPLTVIVLSVLAGQRRPLLTIVALLVLGVLNVLNDARSAFGFTVLAAALVFWQLCRDGRPALRWREVGVLAVLAAGGYWALRQLLLTGALGAEVQERTATQIAQTGSLLLGGRPEWTATWALMKENPLGFGLGTVPSAHDVSVAEQGIAVTRIPTVEGYLKNYLLDGRFELHSIVADLWSNLGPVGILLGLTIGALLVSGLASRLGQGRAPGLVCYLVPLAVWGLAFGPLPTGLPKLTLALGLLLLPRLVPSGEGRREASGGLARMSPPVDAGLQDSSVGR